MKDKTKHIIAKEVYFTFICFTIGFMIMFVYGLITYVRQIIDFDHGLFVPALGGGIYVVFFAYLFRFIRWTVKWVKKWK